MAEEYKIITNAQPSFYQGTKRKFYMYYDLPEKGTNEATGILLLIAGYGASVSSRIYQKMRREFADRYNLITLQCDYFGSRFMGGNEHLDITLEVLQNTFSQEELTILLQEPERKMELLRGRTLEGEIPLRESRADYNEMGPVQAMDHLVALKRLFHILGTGDIPFDKKRIIIYGQSHGAYLGYLCNAMQPRLFSALIDNSAYLFPYYLDHVREVYGEGEIFSIRKIYDFLAKDLAEDRQIYDLKYWYLSFENSMTILSYHGSEDTMIPFHEKEKFLRKVCCTKLFEIGEKDVDRDIFYSATHGLSADFIRMFEQSWDFLEHELPKTSGGQWEETEVVTDRFYYQISLQGEFPMLHRKKRTDTL